MVKVTLTLDETTVERLKRAAARRQIPKSQFVREAIEHYHAAGDRMNGAESQRMVHGLEQLLARIPKRPVEETESELREIRRARRHGGRAHRTE